MRTVRVIKSEAYKALEAFNKHFNGCAICNHRPQYEEEEIICHEGEWLYEEYEYLLSEADYQEQLFKAELKERSSN